uniref:BESS domain-containing protein n=1 Tax=Anopheles culicifacies TaxID=139723 RepID=A0A182M3C6_9DIPT
MEACSVEESSKKLPFPTAKNQSNKSKSFNQKDTLHLIECVRKQPKLWHRQFIRKRLSSCISEWEDIQRKEFPEYTVKQLKVRWKTVRDSYRREIRHIECGASSKSRWPLFDSMLFLDGHFRLRKSVQCKVPALVDIKRVKSSRSNKPVVVSPSELLSILQPVNEVASKTETLNSNERDHEEHASCLPSVDANDEPVAMSEVTFSNKFRSRLKSEAVSANVNDPCNGDEQAITDSQFMMNLVPYLQILPQEKKFEVRLKMLQLIANAALNANNSDK